MKAKLYAVGMVLSLVMSFSSMANEQEDNLTNQYVQSVIDSKVSTKEKTAKLTRFISEREDKLKSQVDTSQYYDDIRYYHNGRHGRRSHCQYHDDWMHW